MVSFKKKEVLQIIDDLIQIDKALPKAQCQPDKIKLLCSCQDAAILVGNYLESLDVDCSDIVEQLGEYCESVYQIGVEAEEDGQGRDWSEHIQKQLAAIRAGIETRFPNDRKEIVLLPYKASMWDSLESVWRAADADPDCDAYVVPIPYYDRNPDGSIREMHYEGNQYPEDVPVIRYEDYDFEGRHPDMIYIHNPYDGGNVVTTVHPFFYSNQLRKYTDCLVYIPYFILNEVELDNPKSLEKLQPYCITAAVQNADRVIVQSENMREAYIRILVSVFGDTDLHGRRWIDKILGLGSPKIDKVLHTSREDLEIPPAWLKIIEKPDGSWKKILLYNTSLSALLQSNEQMLEKMKCVFQILYGHREDIALLWRPHPLIESTLAAMRPELYAEYEQIKEEYQQAGWGIYDDTPDLDRAIVLSDAYYGDESSVVQLAKKIGLGIMIQDVNVNY